MCKNNAHDNIQLRLLNLKDAKDINKCLEDKRQFNYHSDMNIRTETEIGKHTLYTFTHVIKRWKKSLYLYARLYAVTYRIYVVKLKCLVVCLVS